MGQKVAGLTTVYSADTSDVTTGVQKMVAETKNAAASMNSSMKGATNGIHLVGQSADEMGRTIGRASSDATRGMALLTHEMGISMPRALRAWIAEIPAVGAAMSMAFNGI